MLSQVSVLVHKVGERAYHFLCDPNSPLSDIKEALFQFIKFVGEMEDKAKEQASQASQENPSPDETVEKRKSDD